MIGGAAARVPPVIGWAAVTGHVGIPACCSFRARLLLDAAALLGAVVAYPQGLRGAGVRCSPCHCIPETTRQIALYTILMVAISLVLWAVARMGPVYLVPAPSVRVPVAGLPPGEHTVRPRRHPPRGAIRLYRYSISYLTLLFAAVAADAPGARRDLILLVIGIPRTRARVCDQDAV